MSHPHSVDLKNGIYKRAGARHFSFCLLLLQHLLLGASLTVEYPSESAPPLSGEEGAQFPGYSFAGWELGRPSLQVACRHPCGSSTPCVLCWTSPYSCGWSAPYQQQGGISLAGGLVRNWSTWILHS